MSRKTRKLIWSAPLVAVFAVVGALALFVALSPNGAQADHVDLPGIVLDVTAAADGRDTVDVTWKAPSSGGTPDHYRIDRSEDGDNWMRLVQMHTGSDLSISDMDGIKPGKTYHYRVFGVNAAGTGPSSDLSDHSMATTDDSVRPGAVRMLTATVDGPNQINLSWYPPEDDGGSSVTRYCISTAEHTADDSNDTGSLLPTAASTGRQLGDATLPCAHDTAPRAWAVPVGSPDTGAGHLSAIAAGTSSGVIVVRSPEDGSMKVSYMHKNLPSETSRRYEVYAVNANGMSTTASAVAPIPETDEAGKPGKPTLRLVPTFSGDGTAGSPYVPTGAASLYWTWPDDGGKDIDSWQVQRRIDNGEWTDLGTAAADAQATEDDLAARSAVGGPEYAIDGTDLLPDAATADDRSMSETTRYRVRAYNGSSGAWSNTASVTIKATWVITDGTGANVFSTPRTTPVGTVTPTTDKYLRQIDLSWTDQPATSYLIDYSEPVTTEAEREWKPLQTNTGYTKSTYNHRVGLDPGVQRQYRVISLSSGAYGTISTATGGTKAATKPAAVTPLRTSSDDPTMIMLDWDKPTVDGGQPITGYRVEISVDDDSWPESLDTAAPPTAVTHSSESCTPTAGTICVREVDGADNTMYTLGGLDAGTVRWFRVFAINKVSRADASTPAIVNDFPDADDARITPSKKGTSAKSGTPGMPLDLTVQAARDANEDDPTKLGIDILWNAPDDPAGDEVTGYEIARRTKDSTDAAWSDWDDDWASISGEGSDFLRTYFTDTDEPDNLDNGEMREYRVTAKSGAGSGPTTDPVVYPVDTSHTPIVLMKPVLTATPGTGSVTLTWTGNDAAMDYTVAAVKQDLASGFYWMTDITETTHTVPNLDSGDTYYFIVAACGDAGCVTYLWSNPITATPN